MHLGEMLYGIPKPAFIVAMFLGFIWWWPAGLATLAYLVASGRMGGRCRNGRVGRWYNTAQPAGENGAKSKGCGWGMWQMPNQAAQPAPSGNRAFDDYRADTLKRLEEEQKEFVEYLERLRHAKDKAEFDQFMSDRRRPATTAPDAPSPI